MGPLLSSASMCVFCSVQTFVCKSSLAPVVFKLLKSPVDVGSSHMMCNSPIQKNRMFLSSQFPYFYPSFIFLTRSIFQEIFPELADFGIWPFLMTQRALTSHRCWSILPLCYHLANTGGIQPSICFSWQLNPCIFLLPDLRLSASHLSH